MGPTTVGKKALSERVLATGRSLEVASKKLGPEAKEQFEEVQLAQRIGDQVQAQRVELRGARRHGAWSAQCAVVPILHVEHSISVRAVGSGHGHCSQSHSLRR